LASPRPHPPLSPVGKLDWQHTVRLRKIDNLLTGEGGGESGGGSKSYDKAWSSIYHSILSGILYFMGRSRIVIGGEGGWRAGGEVKGIY
jgi:hypothetical protein